MRVDRLHAGIVGGRDLRAAFLLVVVVDAADERRNQRHARFGARHGLRKAEQQRHVAVNALALELTGGADAFPRAADLDQDALAGDARLARKARSVRAPLQWIASVSKLSRASTSVETRPGTIFRISQTEIHGQVIHERLGPLRGGRRFSGFQRRDRRCGRYCGCCDTFNSSDGLVVASCGWYCRIDSRSPVSATTVVTRFKESSKDIRENNE